MSKTSNTINAKIRLRKDTTGNWSNIQYRDTILLDGELAIIIDPSDGTYNFKIGDGTTKFVNLPYLKFNKIQVGNGTNDGKYSLSQGFNTKSTGNYSHAEGFNKISTGKASHSEGLGWTLPEGESEVDEVYGDSTGYGSHVEGLFCNTKGFGSHSQGVNTHDEGYFGSFVWQGYHGQPLTDQELETLLNNSSGALEIVKQIIRNNPRYRSHGHGTYNVNPVGGIKGFYIGEESLDKIIPTKTSQLTNDSNFATKSYVNSGLTSKQDKLSDKQIEAIDSIVGEKTIVTYNDGTTVELDISGEINKNHIPNVANITSIKFGNTVTSIYNKTFAGCNNLNTVIIPGSVIDIKDEAFSACNNLQNVTIGNGVKNINSTAFRYCYNIQDIIIPESVEYIGYGCFYACTKLKNVILKNNNLQIGALVFKSCSALKNIEIPKFLTDIPQEAFAWTGLSGALTIPDTVTSIGVSAFYDCSSLTSVTIPKSVTSIGVSAFSGCSGLQKVIFKGKTLAEVQAMANYAWGITNTSIIETWNDASQEWVSNNYVKSKVMTVSQYEQITPESDTLYFLSEE